MELGGQYEGELVDGRFNGRGVYNCDDSRYEGNFLNGAFHGEGILYVKGGSYQGFWKEGKLVEGGFVFEDGLQHKKVGNKYWEYCSPYDHRFYNEIKENVRIGEKLRHSSAHENKVPKDCYDTIDGYYDVKKHVVFSYTTNEQIRTPNSDEIDFILKNCRVGK